MKIAGLQLDIAWKNPQQNFSFIEKQIQKVDADLILLPEMFSTGFCMDAQEIADRNNETLNWLIAMATNYQKAIGGSVSVEEFGKFYNRFYFVFPDGTYQYYDKKHLFSYSGEDKIYTAGSKRVIVTYKNIRFLLQTCYDIRFPIFSRNKKDYDAILYVANFPKPRIDAWNSLLKARAIENLSYVFGLNRIGTDGNNLYYPESSNCYFADGSLVSQKKEDWIIADIDIEKINQFRSKFRFLDDADV